MTKLKWFDESLVGVKRWRLYAGKQQTPYFVDRIRYSNYPDMRYGLYGSGMHPAGIAAELGYFRTVKEAKQQAEQYAAKDLTPVRE